MTQSSGRLNATKGTTLVSYAGVLTVGATYSLSFDYVMTSGFNIRLRSEVNDGGATVVTKNLSGAVNYSHTFTATGSGFSLAAEALSFSGTIDNLRLYKVDSSPATLPVAPTLTGTAKAGATVTISDTVGGNTTVLGTTVANSSGVWTFVASGITSGSHSITAAQTGLASGTTSGNSSAFAFTVEAAQLNAPNVGIIPQLRISPVGDAHPSTA